MSVRQSLLAILAQGPCYGHQLRNEFERRTGAIWPLNVGQIYNTLERLERDGLVSRGDSDAQGHVYWEITHDGAAEAARWLASPIDRGTTMRDELAIKLALTATLPGADPTAVIAAQRGASESRLWKLRDARRTHDDASVEGLARALITDAMILSAEAELTWLDHVDARLAQHPEHARARGLTSERPKRGRPARTGVAITG